MEASPGHKNFIPYKYLNILYYTSIKYIGGCNFYSFSNRGAENIFKKHQKTPETVKYSLKIACFYPMVCYYEYITNRRSFR
jgi:hypothetical protein